MSRLGELLVAARLLDPEQIERALRAQVLWGGRLGTNLIELGYLDLDGISRALGRQHGVPAALARHFEKADRELQERLPTEVATKWSVVPLLHIGAQKKIAVAVLDPLPADALSELADAFLCDPAGIVVSVAAEMRVRYHLERVYGMQRAKRFLRTKGKSVTPFPQFDNVPVPVDSDAEVAVAIPVDEAEHPTGVHEVVEADAAAPAPIATAPTAAALSPGPLPAPATLAAGAPAEVAPAAATPAAGEPAPPSPFAGEDPDDIARMIDDAIAVATGHEPTAPAGRDRRTYVRTLADDMPMPPPPRASTPVITSADDSQTLTPTGVWSPVDDEAPAPAPRPSQTDLPAPSSVVPAPAPPKPVVPMPLGRMKIKKVAANDASKDAVGTATTAAVPTITSVPTSFLEATRAIRRGANRDRVAELVVFALDRFVPACDAALLLVIRGDVAISWKHFSRTCTTVGEIAVPLDQAGLVPTVVARNTTARAAVADLGAIDEALMRSLGELRGDLVVVPIAIADKVMCLIATVTEADAPVEGVESVAAAAAAAFARLIRDASR